MIEARYKALRAALLSGDYKKGCGHLRINDATPEVAHWCCLGVMCNLHAQAHPEEAAKQINPDAYYSQTAYLPYQVVDWMGMRSSQGMLPDSSYTYIDRWGESTHADSLARINDATDNFTEVVKALDLYWKEM